MRVRYTLRSFADREEIFGYIDKRSPSGARAVKRDIVRAIRRLEQFPRSAPATDEPGVYELIVPRRPYKVYYRIENDEVWLVHIRDARRRPWEGEG
jgi:plasmid stabilization system protein ParE